MGRFDRSKIPHRKPLCLTVWVTLPESELPYFSIPKSPTILKFLTTPKASTLIVTPLDFLLSLHGADSLTSGDPYACLPAI